MGEARLAIDCGSTSTSAVVAWPDGRWVPLMFDGEPALPSAVLLGGDGTVLTGRGHLTPGTGPRSTASSDPDDGVAKFDNTYGTDRGNLAYRDLTGLTDGFEQILAGCATLLRPGGTVVVTARPWRKNGQLVDLPSAVIAAGLRAGLVPTERCVALLAAVRDGHLVARPSFFQLQAVRKARTHGTPLHLITHEDVLIFRRPQAEPTPEDLTDTGGGPSR